MYKNHCNFNQYVTLNLNNLFIVLLLYRKAESLKIVLWTGGTWFLELLGFIFPRYIIRENSGLWYDYIWYIPISINALRGFGIFAIIVLTPEKRKDIRRQFKHTKIKCQKILLAIRESVGIGEPTDNRQFSSKHPVVNERGRNMSVSTMISTLSTSFYNSTSTSKKEKLTEDPRKLSVASYFSIKLDNLRKASGSVTHENISWRNSITNSIGIANERTARKYGMARSVSQTDSPVSLKSFCTKLDVEEIISENEGLRKFSAPLPQVKEESIFEPESDQKIEKMEAKS